MEIDRRTMCRAIGAGLLLPCLPQMATAHEDTSLFAAAYRNTSGAFGAAIFDETGEIACEVELPARGHGFAVHRPSSRVVAFARRPGNFAVSLNHDGSAPPAWFQPPAGRHFYGHGVFTPDGRLLLATENEIASGRGIVGIYDATDGYRSVGAFPTGGIGPHDLAFMPDGRTLVVANGGIRTDPGMGRTPLNIEDMRPCLAYIDTRNGDFVDNVRLAPGLHKLSLRHLAVTARGLVVVGCQHKGPRNETPGLIVTHELGAEPGEFPLSGAATRSLRNYVSSVAADTSGQYAAVTSSRGGVALVMDLQSRRLVKQQRIRDVSGVAPAKGDREAFFTTAGTGMIGRIGASGAVKTRGHSWDNHLIRVT